ncbi:MAG: hypothetical protein ACRDQZ_13070 [Mycobacteriales bacterium]
MARPVTTWSSTLDLGIITVGGTVVSAQAVPEQGTTVTVRVPETPTTWNTAT